MVKIRACEEKMVDPILKGEIRCPVHLYSGEEAVAAGICEVLTEQDYVFGTHRSHGHYLAKGGDLNKLVAEIYGKDSGCSKGRGGSMHIIDIEKGVLGAAPIVAGTIPLALGAALSSKIKNEQKVTVSFFGDGACGEGVLYESLNFASLHKLPIIFVCENNFYSTHMPIEECRSNKDIYRIGEPFDISSLQVDGNNVLNVYDAALTAADQCRKGKGPYFIECHTYRLRGHVGPDDNIQGTHQDIRDDKEVAEWKKRDPIIQLQEYLIENNHFTVENLEDIDRAIESEVEEAFIFARQSPYPTTNEMENYVFKE